MLHPLAQQFAGVAEVYDHGRPGYPPEAITIAAREFELHARDRVADLGAGTGKLDDRARGRGARRRRGGAARSDARAPRRLAARVEVVARQRSGLPLADSSLAACFSADAFHWFDADAAAAELYRVLRPGGGVALLWHLPGWEAEPPAWWSKLVELLNSIRTGHPGFAGEQGRDGFARHGGFEPFSHHVVRSAFATDRERLLAYVQSISYVAGHPERDRVLDEVRVIVRDVEPHESPVRTDMWLTHRR